MQRKCVSRAYAKLQDLYAAYYEFGNVLRVCTAMYYHLKVESLCTTRPIFDGTCKFQPFNNLFYIFSRYLNNAYCPQIINFKPESQNECETKKPHTRIKIVVAFCVNHCIFSLTQINRLKIDEKNYACRNGKATLMLQHNENDPEMVTNNEKEMVMMIL